MLLNIKMIIICFHRRWSELMTLFLLKEKKIKLEYLQISHFSFGPKTSRTSHQSKAEFQLKREIIKIFIDLQKKNLESF